MRHLVGGGFEALRDRAYCELVTFRRSGVAVATPVWFALSGARLFVKTESPSGKVKRIGNNPAVAIAACTLRGRRLGPLVPARARVLDSGEAPEAERALAARYGFGRRLFGRFRRAGGPLARPDARLPRDPPGGTLTRRDGMDKIRFTAALDRYTVNPYFKGLARLGLTLPRVVILASGCGSGAGGAPGVARLLPEDDPHARLRTMVRRTVGLRIVEAVTRLSMTAPLTVLIDLRPLEGARPARRVAKPRPRRGRVPGVPPIVCGTEGCETDGDCGVGERCTACVCRNAPACTSGIDIAKRGTSQVIVARRSSKDPGGVPWGRVRIVIPDQLPRRRPAESPRTSMRDGAVYLLVLRFASSLRPSVDRSPHRLYEFHVALDRQAARAYAQRWRIVQAASRAELRSMSILEKARRLSQLLTSSAFLDRRGLTAEDSIARRRWSELQRRYRA